MLTVQEHRELLKDVDKRHLWGLARCPRCGSPARNLHPAMQHEGEVQMCEHLWHEPEKR